MWTEVDLNRLLPISVIRYPVTLMNVVTVTNFGIGTVEASSFEPCCQPSWM